MNRNIAVLLVAVVSQIITHARAQTPDQLDELFHTGDVKQAVRGYRTHVISEARKQGLIAKTAPSPSASSDTDDPALLAAAYWLNRGVFHKLTGNASAYQASLGEALKALQTGSEAASQRQRRVVLALFLEALGSSANFADLIQAADKVSGLIDELPIGENSSRFANQLKAEYVVEVTYRLTALPLELKGDNPPSSPRDTQRIVAELLAKKSLAQLLATSSPEEADSYEAFLDRMLFENANERIIATYKTMFSGLASSIPSEGRQLYTTLCMVWASEARDYREAYFLMGRLSDSGADPRTLLPHLLGTTRVADDFGFPETSRKLLLCLYQLKHVSSQLDPPAQLEIAKLYADHRLPDAAREQIERLLSATADPATRRQAQSVILEVFYQDNDYRKVADLSADLVSAEDAQPSPDIWLLRGKSLAKLGEATAAAEAFEAFLRAKPYADEAPGLLLLLSRLYLSTGDQDNARRVLSALITSHPDSRESAEAKPTLTSLE